MIVWWRIALIVAGLGFVFGSAAVCGQERPQLDEPDRLNSLEKQVHGIEDAIHCTGGSVPIRIDARVVGCQMPH